MLQLRQPSQLGKRVRLVGGNGEHAAYVGSEEVAFRRLQPVHERVAERDRPGIVVFLGIGCRAHCLYENNILVQHYGLVKCSYFVKHRRQDCEAEKETALLNVPDIQA